MNCCIAELRNKEVICKDNGARLGNVDDVEIDTLNGKIVFIVIYSRDKFFGKGSDIKIPWDKVCVIGDDTVLVDCCPKPCPPAASSRRKLFGN